VPVGVLLVLKTLEDEQYVAIKAYKFTILRDFLRYHIMHICAIPIQSTDSMITKQEAFIYITRTTIFVQNYNIVDKTVLQ